MPLARYACKGIRPDHARRMYIKPIAQGIVVGKRSGVSRALGKAAIKRRREAGFAKPTKGWVHKSANHSQRLTVVPPRAA